MGCGTAINAALFLQRQNLAFVAYLITGAAIFAYSESPE
jgi:hypothetical protein